MITIQKRDLPELTMALFVKNFIEHEGNLRRNVFYKGRESEIKARGGFEFQGMEVKFAYLSPYEQETIYNMIEGKAIFKACIYANYKIRKNGKWEQLSALINSNNGIMGLPCILPVSSDTDFQALKNQLREVATQIGNMIYFNWRNILPNLESYVNDTKKQRSLFIWLVDDVQYVWAKSYKELSNLVESTEGQVRLAYLPEDFTRPENNCFANKSEILAFMSQGNMSSPDELSTLLEEEYKKDEQALLLKSLLA